MGHHHHHHHHDTGGSGDGRLLFSIALNLLITVAEVVGGLLSGSLSLLSDALHNFSDTSSLIIAYGARRLSRREANAHQTFGYQRAEILGAFINLISLVLISLFLVKEAIERFFNPASVDGGIMMIVACIGLVANLVTALLLYRESKTNLNMKSAFLHIVTDTVSSVIVVLGGLLILWYELYFIDPLFTLLIAGYILWQSVQMLRETIDILMQSTPPDLDLDEIRHDIQQLDGVCDMHHLHVWRLDEHKTALEAHIVIEEEDVQEMESIKSTIKHRLTNQYHISHTTLEFEFTPCSHDKDHQCY